MSESEISKCKKCEKSLAGKKYIDFENNPYCVPCYEENFTNSCFKCKEKINAESKDLAFKEMHWHDKCFLCGKCGNSLVDQSFLMKEDTLYCQDCHSELFGQRCDKCNQLFKVGQKKYEYKGEIFHNECFTCGECNETIGAQSFVPKDNKIICVKCFDKLYSKKCSKCKNVIKESGITYKEETYHKECFLCANCSKQLAGSKFTMKDDKIYCIDCYGEIFAMKCQICNKPITGLGGTKFITFENKNWHSDCFNCSKCKEPLVGKGFALKEEKVICPNCNE